MTGFIDDLPGGAESGREAFFGHRQLRCADQGRLLTVQHLRQGPALGVMANFSTVLFIHFVPDIGAVDQQRAVRHAQRVVRVELVAPVDVGINIPLVGLGLLIQRIQAVIAEVVGLRHERIDREIPLDRLAIIECLFVLCLHDHPCTCVRFD